MNSRERCEIGRRIQSPSVSFFAFQDIITSVVGIFVLVTIIMMIELVSKTVEGQNNGKRVADTLGASLQILEEQVEDLRQRNTQLSTRSKTVGAVQRFNADEIRSEIQQRIQQVTEQTKRSQAVTQKIQKVLIASKNEFDQLQKEGVASQEKRDELKRLVGKLQYIDTKIGTLTVDNPLIFRNADLAGRSLIVIDIQRFQIEVLDLQRDTRKVFSGGTPNAKWEGWCDQQAMDQLHFLLLVRPGAAVSFNAIRTQLEKAGASFGFDVIATGRSIRLRSEAGK